MENQQAAFYGDFYREAYTNIGALKAQDAQKQAEGALTLLGARHGCHVLDWCGGWGRHAIPMAKMGYQVSLLDYSRQYVRLAEEEAARSGVALKTVVADFRETPAGIQADCAVNLFTAGVGHFGKEEDLVAFRSLFEALKPGGHFLIDTMGLPWILRNFREASWRASEDGTKRLLERREFNFASNDVTTTWTYQDVNSGTEESQTTLLHVYSPAELMETLRAAGFDSFKLYGGFDGAEFTMQSQRIVLVCHRP